MNERIPSDPELGGSNEPPRQSSVAGRVIASRRQFAKAGAAAPVVLGSLLSKPALAAAPYNCTISGQMSGNTSAHPGTVDCKTLGMSPGYWKNATSWPAGTVKGNLPTPGGSFSGSKGTVFGGFVSGNATLTDGFRYKSESGACNVYGMRDPSFGTCVVSNKATFLQVLNTPGGLNDTMIYALGRATVATILNSLSKGPDYPITVAQALKMFNAVCTLGGKYQVNSTVYWTDAQVMAYFQSLYS